MDIKNELKGLLEKLDAALKLAEEGLLKSGHITADDGFMEAPMILSELQKILTN